MINANIKYDLCKPANEYWNPDELKLFYQVIISRCLGCLTSYVAGMKRNNMAKIALQLFANITVKFLS